MEKTRKEFLENYIGQLEGYKIIGTGVHDEGEDDDFIGGYPFSYLLLKGPKGDYLQVDISQDEEGNGGGFLFISDLKK